MKSVENKLMLEKLFEVKNVDDREMYERNKEIFIARYVYDMTLVEIGKEFNLSSERIRQIIAKWNRRFIYKINNGLV
jgi:DNA-directed RNA polymerase sigma subunit (sigma70/sigma32)